MAIYVFQLTIYPTLRSGYYRQLSTRIDSYKFSFFPSTTKLWNSPTPFQLFIINSINTDQFCNNL